MCLHARARSISAIYPAVLTVALAACNQILGIDQLQPGTAPACFGGTVSCDDHCIDPSSNREFCGATPGCGVSSGSAGTRCGSGQICGGGECITLVGTPCTVLDTWPSSSEPAIVGLSGVAVGTINASMFVARSGGVDGYSPNGLPFVHTDPGELTSPSSLTLDRYGSLFVADADAVKQYLQSQSNTSWLLSRVATFGAGEQISFVTTSQAADASDVVYTANSQTVIAYSTTGAHSEVVRNSVARDPQLTSLAGAACAVNGPLAIHGLRQQGDKLYVSIGDCVVRMIAQTLRVDQVGANLGAPGKIAGDLAGHFYVTHASPPSFSVHRLADVDWTSLMTCGATSGAAQLIDPQGIDADSDANVYVADRGKGRLIKFATLFAP